MEDKKRKLIVIVVFGIIGLILGTTIAWFTWISGNTDITLLLGGVNVTYTAGADITGVKLRPVSSKEIGVEKEYAIKKDITVSANKVTYFNLYLNAESFPEGLKHESFRWEIYEGSMLLNGGDFSNTVQGDKITLLSSTTINSTARNLSLYIWIDGNVPNPDSMQNQTYRFVLNADASNEPSNLYVDPSGANSPDLMEGMVPITLYNQLKDLTDNDKQRIVYDYFLVPDPFDYSL